MYQLIDVKLEQNHSRVTILLDDSQVDAHGNPHRKYLETLSLGPAPRDPTQIDAWLQSALQNAEPFLASRLSLVSKPPFDPIAKWRGFKWDKTITIP